MVDFKVLHFAAIGTREPTPDQLDLLYVELAKLPKDAELHTGAAVGIDQAAARWWWSFSTGLVHLHFPWAGYERCFLSEAHDRWKDRTKIIAGSSREDLEMACKLHPTPYKLTPGVKQLHARNVGIIRASELVIALPGSKPWGGGTAMGVRVAQHLGKPMIVHGLLVPEFEATKEQAP